MFKQTLILTFTALAGIQAWAWEAGAHHQAGAELAAGGEGSQLTITIAQNGGAGAGGLLRREGQSDATPVAAPDTAGAAGESADVAEGAVSTLENRAESGALAASQLTAASGRQVTAAPGAVANQAVGLATSASAVAAGLAVAGEVTSAVNAQVAGAVGDAVTASVNGAVTETVNHAVNSTVSSAVSDAVEASVRQSLTQSVTGNLGL